MIRNGQTESAKDSSPCIRAAAAFKLLFAGMVIQGVVVLGLIFACFFGGLSWIKGNLLLFGLANLIFSSGALLLVLRGFWRVRVEWADVMNQLQERTGEWNQSQSLLAATLGEFKQERNLLSALLDNSGDCIYFKDRESRFLRCSANMAKIFHTHGVAEVVGKCDRDFFSEEHARDAFVDEQNIIQTGEPVMGKVEKETWPDGHVSWALTSKMPLRNEAGEVVGTFGISKDITPLKEAEAKLNQAHKQLVETSRQAGMAEVATSVLHNVGNVLNSVNVSSSMIADKLRSSKVANLAKSVELLRAHKEDLGIFLTKDPKGKQLHRLSAQAGRLSGAGTGGDCGAKSAPLVANIVHIKEIVAMQQNYASSSGVLENIKAADLVEDALRMNNGAMVRHNVKIVANLQRRAAHSDREAQGAANSGQSDPQCQIRLRRFWPGRQANHDAHQPTAKTASKSR